MYSTLLDDETMSKVIEAAPADFDDIDRAARKSLVALAGQTENATHAKTHLDFGNLSYTLPVKKLAEILFDEYSPHMIGRALRELGLKTDRKREGFVVVWNSKQIEILRNYLGV